MTRTSRWPRISRDTALLVGGMAGFAHEVLVTPGERPTLLLACLAMMGLPLVLRSDEKAEP